MGLHTGLRYTRLSPAARGKGGGGEAYSQGNNNKTYSAPTVFHLFIYVSKCVRRTTVLISNLSLSLLWLYVMVRYGDRDP